MIVLSIPDMDRESAMSFITLVKNNFPQDMFEQSAEIMLGDDWRGRGLAIIKAYAPELESCYSGYVEATGVD